MTHQRFFRDRLQRHTLNSAGGACEVPVHNFARDANRFEDLRPAVALHRGDAHLAGDLDDAFVGGLDVVLLRLLEAEFRREHLLAVHVADRFKRDVRIDRARAKTNEQTEVVRLARFTGFDD